VAVDLVVHGRPGQIDGHDVGRVRATKQHLAGALDIDLA
jgi:hypothetical protein